MMGLYLSNLVAKIKLKNAVNIIEKADIVINAVVRLILELIPMQKLF
jgi:hypothetical protein